jgi:threonylcarbamoyladenosine tRNA methylthiotransferase MtaB
MSTQRTIAFHTLGCKLNFSETSSICSLFTSAGYKEVNFDEVADYYLINTCSVTEQADKKCRKVIRKVMHQNATAKVILIGCYAQLVPQELASIPGVSMVLGAAEKFNILHYMEQLSESGKELSIHVGPISDVNEFIPSYSIEHRTRTFLKVQDGCDYKCTFCTIPLARGRSRSATVEQITKRCTELMDKGVKEIVLTGVNIGDFGNGSSILEGSRPQKDAILIDLLLALDDLEGDTRFRISSIEPNLCTDEIIEFIGQSRHFMPHLHMPIQSGDNEILSLMKRRYKVELYMDRVSKIRKTMPDACIGADVIVGFPGESDFHFLNTFNVLHELPVSYLHVFTYSERDNTVAAELKKSVPMMVRRDRSILLRSLSEKKRKSFSLQCKGQIRKVLIEQSPDGTMMEGYTDNYIKITTRNNPTLINTIIDAKLENLNPDHSYEI